MYKDYRLYHRFNFFYTRYYYYNNIVDLMHVQILNEHLCF